MHKSRNENKFLYYFVLSTISTISDIYWLSTGIFSLIIFCITYIINAVIIEKPIPIPIPFDIPESWIWVRLSDIIDVRDGTHDSPKYVPMGIPLVTSKNLSNGTIDYGNVKYITQEDADKINARSMVDDDDILFAMIGSIGNPVLVKKD